MKKYSSIFLLTLIIFSCSKGNKNKFERDLSDENDRINFSQFNNLKAFYAINKLLKNEPAGQYPEYADVVGDKKYEWYYGHTSQTGASSEFEKKRQIEALKSEVDAKIDAFDLSAPVVFKAAAETEGTYNFEKKGYKVPVEPASALLTDPRLTFEEKPEFFIPMSDGDAEEFEKHAQNGFMGFSLDFEVHALITAPADANGKKVVTTKITKIVCKAAGDEKVLAEQKY